MGSGVGIDYSSVWRVGWEYGGKGRKIGDN